MKRITKDSHKTKTNESLKALQSHSGILQRSNPEHPLKQVIIISKHQENKTWRNLPPAPNSSDLLPSAHSPRRDPPHPPPNRPAPGQGLESEYIALHLTSPLFQNALPLSLDNGSSIDQSLPRSRNNSALMCHFHEGDALARFAAQHVASERSLDG
jgi:hypothetical protein